MDREAVDDLFSSLAPQVVSFLAARTKALQDGETWFEEDRNDASKLIALLEETSHDCQTLIDARHEALTPEERDWFLTKCSTWKAQFDETLASLKSGSITLETARSQSDLTMMKLVAALRSGPTA